MFYIISHESGEVRCGEFESYSKALNYAESWNGGRKGAR